MITRLSRKDIPLQVLETGYIDINKDAVMKVLRKILVDVEQDTIEALYDFAYTVVELPIPPENASQAKEYINEFVRIIKVQARPLLLGEQLESSGITLINPREIYNINDIHASYTMGAYMNLGAPGSPYIDVSKVVIALINNGIMTEDEREMFISDLNSFVASSREWGFANLTWNRNEFEYRIQNIASKFIDNFIYSRWLVIYNNELMDSTVTPLVFINKDGYVKISEDQLGKVIDLLLALGYGGNEKNDEEVSQILEKLVYRLQELVDNNEPDDNEYSMSLYVNLGFVNAIYLNALDGNFTAKEFDFEKVNELEFSQIDVEQYFLDATINMIQYNNLMEFVKGITGKPSEDVQDITVELMDTINKTAAKALKENPNDVYKIFKIVTGNLKIESEFLKSKFTPQEVKLEVTE